jgi:Domain of unknown function (DUF1848).
MASGKWGKVGIVTGEGRVEGIAPVIVSASRSTDIPAFYSEWLVNRLEEGYVKWINPFNGRHQYVSFAKTRVIVFWTKDAMPLVPYLDLIDKKGINYYFQFTLNDYEKEGFEAGARKLSKRIDTFKMLSERLGKQKVIWRFDPLVLTDKVCVDTLLDRVFNIGNKIAAYTDKLVFSFADISSYRKVINNLQSGNINYKEFTSETMEAIAKGLNEMNRNWNIDLATCSEGIDLSKFNIQNNKCIDDGLMIKLFSQDKELMEFLCNLSPGRLKDKGQRECCGCIISKDIGQYNTCSHKCVYCYANSSPGMAESNYKRYLLSDRKMESIV